MIQLSLDSLLFAQEDRLEYLTRGFRQRPKEVDVGNVMIVVGVVIGFIIVLWILSRLMDRRQQRGPSNSRLGLFLSLCNAHGLHWSQKWLLWRVARHHRLRDPARVFLEPERFDGAKLGRAFTSRADKLKTIGQRLFSGLPKEGKSP